MAVESPRHASIEPTHLGQMLAEIVIPAAGKTKAEIAHMLRLSRQTLYAILSQKQPVTPQVAVRLGKLFGNGPDLWANMHTAYDIWHAQRDVDTSGIPRLEAG